MATATATGAAPFVCDPYTSEYQTNLHALYRTLRDEHPVYHLARRRLWIVSRNADVLAVLKDDETFSSAGVEEALPLEPMLIYMDGAPHRGSATSCRAPSPRAG
jgi:cytochrome P450